MLAAVQSLDGVLVSIVRNSMRTNGVPALVGETITTIDDGTGAVTEARSRDFIILKENYAFGGSAKAPEPDDYIIDVVSGETLTYQVLPFFSDEQKRWSDPFGEAWRIHAKLITPPEDLTVLVTFDTDTVYWDSTVYSFDQA